MAKSHLSKTFKTFVCGFVFLSLPLMFSSSHPSNVFCHQQEKRVTASSLSSDIVLTSDAQNSYTVGSFNWIEFSLEGGNVLSTLQLEVRYDPEVIRIGDIQDKTEISFDFGQAHFPDEGLIRLTYLFSDSLPETTKVLSLGFSILDTEKTESSFDVSVTEALDRDGENADFSGRSFHFFLTREPSTAAEVDFAIQTTTTQIWKDQEVTFTISSSRLGDISGASFSLGYDKDVFEFVRFEPCGVLLDEKTIFRVNPDNPGTVSFSYVTSAHPLEEDLIRITLKAVAQKETTSYVTLVANSISDFSGMELKADDVSVLMNVHYNSSSEIKNAILVTGAIDESKPSLDFTFSLPEGPALEIAQIDIRFNADQFVYSSFEAKETCDYFNTPLINKLTPGLLTIGLLHDSETSSFGDFLTIHFDLVQTCINLSSAQVSVSLSGMKDHSWNDIPDANQNFSFSTKTFHHEEGEWTVSKEPTCGEDGEETLYCSKCGAIISTRMIPATGNHVFGPYEIVEEPTCTQSGSSRRFCQVCGKIEYATIPALDHDEGEWVTTKEATCEEDGLEELFCTRCGEPLGKTRVIPATGHSFTEWETTKEPTCGSEGTLERHCTLCGKTETETIPATGEHTWSEWERVKEPTELEQGLERRRCLVCGKTEEREIPETGEHTWSDWNAVREPTCTEEGLEERTCTDCGTRQTRPIDALGHDAGDWVTTKEPSCSEPGEKELRCARCGEVLDTEEIPATGEHSWSEWTTTKEATSNSEGIEERTCSVCGKTETRSIPKLEESNMNGTVVAILVVGGIIVVVAIGLGIYLYIRRRNI